MTTITQHGFWERYAPDVFPDGFPPYTLFAHRTSDLLDWYLFLAHQTLQVDTLKMTLSLVNEQIWVVQAVQRDATMIFPGNAQLIEVTEDTPTADPQAHYGGLTFSLGTNQFGDRWQPPPPPIGPPSGSAVSADERLDRGIAAALEGLDAFPDSVAGARSTTAQLETEIQALKVAFRSMVTAMRVAQPRQ